MAVITILIADNDSDFLETRCAFLRREGFNVKSALGLMEAKCVLEQEEIDLAILDLRLVNDADEKDFSGLELAKDVAPEVPKIILTNFPAYSAVREALRSRLAGSPVAVDFVAKPDGLQELLTSVRREVLKLEQTQQAHVALRLVLARRYNLEELRTLCFDLGVEFDDLPGEGKTAKIRELIKQCRRAGMLDDLIAATRGDHGPII